MENNSISDLKLARLSAEDRSLVKAKVIDADTLRLTSDGKDLLIELLFVENKKLVVDAVTVVQKEAKKTKSE